MAKSRNKNRKRKEKQQMAGIPDNFVPPENFDELIGDISSALETGKAMVKETAEAPPEPPKTAATLPPQATATEAQAQAWYYDELRKRIFLMQKLNAIAYSLGQLAEGVNSQMTIGNGYHDLTINKPVLFARLETALRNIKTMLAPALVEVKAILEAKE